MREKCERCSLKGHLIEGDVDRGLNLARVRTLGLTAGPRSLHPDQSENLSGVLIRVARSKIPSLSPSFRIIRASGPRPRLRSVRFAWHKQSEILKHCRTKCDNSAWPSTPLDRMYPTRAAHAGGIAGLGIFALGIFRRRVKKSLDRKISLDPGFDLPSRASAILSPRSSGSLRFSSLFIRRLLIYSDRPLLTDFAPDEVFFVSVLATLIGPRLFRTTVSFRFPMAVRRIAKCQIDIFAR